MPFLLFIYCYEILSSKAAAAAADIAHDRTKVVPVPGLVVDPEPFRLVDVSIYSAATQRTDRRRVLLFYSLNIPVRRSEITQLHCQSTHDSLWRRSIVVGGE